MPIDKLLIANRGEIAIRIARAARDLGLPCVAVHSRDDAEARHHQHADESIALPGTGVAAYLDADAILSAARQTGCDALHPGYGFLAESAAFASACEAAGVRFVGPTVATLAALGDKLRARELASQCGVPVLPALGSDASVADAEAFFAQHGSEAGIVVKAVAGGGGRGLRRIVRAEQIEAAIARARSEARAAFGDDAIYFERAMPAARHLEVQVVGDGNDVRDLGERECSLQRNHQKVVEMAPSPGLAPALRAELVAHATRMAQRLRVHGLVTFEFLLSPSGETAFIEANPRLQVEHTVTEAVTGIDLVAVQLQLASGAHLADVDLGPDAVVAVRGQALQLRINLESMTREGSAHPAGGTLVRFEMPSGPGIRVDTYGYAGYTTNPSFDSLIAKVIAWSPSQRFADVLARAQRALAEVRIEGSASNVSFLQRLLAHPDVVAHRVDVGWIERHAEAWADPTEPVASSVNVGAHVDAGDPLAVLAHGRRSLGSSPRPRESFAADAKEVVVEAPLQGTVVDVAVADGTEVVHGQELLILEAMKMEHVVVAPLAGTVSGIGVHRGDTIRAGHPLLKLTATGAKGGPTASVDAVDLEHIRPDLAEAIERHAIGSDERRGESVAKRHARGQRTARENVTDLCDEGSFVEYGALVIAAQRRRRPVDELIARTPADGLVCGVGTVNSSLFPELDTRCVVLSYDYMVLAGTQGLQNHRKKDRMFALAREHRLPVVFLTEGGGGRPGDTDGMGVAGLDCLAFRLFAELSGQVPLVGINAGRCFAGNAALLGSCDVVIATRDSNIGMGGPAMIEGGGLGVFRPEDIGPIDVQVGNGVVDVEVADEAEAVAVAKRYLGYFQGELPSGECDDQRLLRHLVPENRLRVYDVRRVIAALADHGSVLELRRGWAAGMVTALARVEGRPLGVIANNPMHLGGAIDSDAADKAARFLQLCDAFGLPVLFLCDTPGIMVGPEAEKSGTVRHAARLFVIGASLSVPVGTIVLRKGYGLGAQAMAGGSFHASSFTVAWPTGEFGGMGLEGAVKLGFRKELEAIDDPAERKRVFDEMVAHAYTVGKGVNMASHFEIDDVIDPADSRRWITTMLAHGRRPGGGRRPCVDPW